MTNLLAVEVAPWVETLCTAIAIVAMLAVPAFILWLTKKVKFLNFIGAIALCYALGIIISVIPIPYDKSMTEMIASIFVAIAIPLILFSFDIVSVKYLAKKTIISFALVIGSAAVVSVVAFFIANAAGLSNASQLSGMTTGLYTGGTPNLVAIGTSLLAPENKDSVIAAAQLSDFFVGGVYFLLILTVIKPIYRKILGDKAKKQTTPVSDEVGAEVNTEVDNTEQGSTTVTDDKATLAEKSANEQNTAGEYDYKSIPRDKKSIGKLIGVIALAIGCLGVGAGLEILINGSLDGSLFIILAVSILGIAFSFIKPIRRVKGSYQCGQYLILIFSLGLSMSIDIYQLAVEILPTLLFFACSQIAVILLHLLLCKLFKIDAGTALITSTAGIYGPPFIAPVANAYGDRELIAPGIICGTLGLAIGTLLGLGIGSLLALF
ncbi:MAG: DUF819 family protein [Clostridiales bacterium]|nr:DUF819 family protein [Clostridiales bacterium]